jgi:hypothetical protein
MSAERGNRLREGQVVAGILDIDPRPTNAAPLAEETYPYDEVPGVFTYATGEELLAELVGVMDDESCGVEAVPVTGQRRLSLWGRMLEVLSMDFTKNQFTRKLLAPDELSEAGYPTTAQASTPTPTPSTPTASNRRTDGEHGGERPGETDGPIGNDVDIGQDQETNDKTNAAPKRNRAGLYATLGELAGAGRQGRHAR